MMTDGRGDRPFDAQATIVFVAAPYYLTGLSANEPLACRYLTPNLSQDRALLENSHPDKSLILT
jgi:hypothetical protein